MAGRDGGIPLVACCEDDGRAFGGGSLAGMDWRLLCRTGGCRDRLVPPRPGALCPPRRRSINLCSSSICRHHNIAMQLIFPVHPLRPHTPHDCVPQCSPECPHLCPPPSPTPTVFSPMLPPAPMHTPQCPLTCLSATSWSTSCCCPSGSLHDARLVSPRLPSKLSSRPHRHSSGKVHWLSTCWQACRGKAAL